MSQVSAVDFTIQEDVCTPRMVFNMLKTVFASGAFQLQRDARSGALYYRGRCSLGGRSNIVMFRRKLAGSPLASMNASIAPAGQEESYVFLNDEPERLEGPWLLSETPSPEILEYDTLANEERDLIRCVTANSATTDSEEARAHLVCSMGRDSVYRVCRYLLRYRGGIELAAETPAKTMQLAHGMRGDAPIVIIHVEDGAPDAFIPCANVLLNGYTYDSENPGEPRRLTRRPTVCVFAHVAMNALKLRGDLAWKVR